MTEFAEIKELDEFKETAEEVADAQSKARGVRKVTDETTLSVAAEVLAEVEWVIRHAESTRLDLGKPYRDYSDKLGVEFKELVSPLGGIAEKLNEEITSFQVKRQEEVDKERARLQKLADRRQERENKKAERLGRDPIIHTPPEIPDAPKTIKLAGGGSIQSKDNWTYEIVDEDELPRELMQPNKGAINKRVKAGDRNIPGLRIYNAGTTAMNF